MKKLAWFFGLVLLCGACSDQNATNPLAGQLGSPEASVGRGANGITVMTMNTFYGADYTPLLTAPLEQIPFIAAQAWGDAQLSNIPARAGRIAALIADNGADVVGLQEAAIYRVQSPGDAIIGGTTPATTVVYDFVQLILDSLTARGLHYTLAAADSTTDIELPVFAGIDGGGNPTFNDVRLTDRDAVLARAGLGVSNPQHAVFQAAIPVDLGGFQTAVHEGWSSVDVPVGSATYRFVSTHLEFQDALPVQLGQVQELIGTFGQDAVPTIIVGDFNSDASGLRPDRATPSYQMMLDAGFTDTWTSPFQHRGDLGLTCCEQDDLSNAEPTFDQRLDFIWAKNIAAQGSSGTIAVARDVVGDDQTDRTAGGLWPSDHAAVVARFNAPASVVATLK